MKKLTTSCLLLILTPLSLLANTDACSLHSQNNFKASYDLQTPQAKTTLNYYRLKDKTAFEYTNIGVSEVWTKTLNDKAFLLRGFDNAKRSIEYEVIDLNMEHKSSSWDKRKNIMSPDNFDFDNVKDVDTNGCVISHYNKTTENSQISMLWNKSNDVLISLKVEEKGQVTYLYTLTEAKDLQENNHVAQVEAYDRTDFADIGDNESDPFFRKMINLGFVSHHEVNIIDANGKSLEMEHNHP